jgi:hypothetical protein
MRKRRTVCREGVIVLILSIINHRLHNDWNWHFNYSNSITF